MKGEERRGEGGGTSVIVHRESRDQTKPFIVVRERTGLGFPSGVFNSVCASWESA